MKNVVGTPARGENFFRRDSEVEKIRERIDAGNNLQIAAPRRVGKTSILWHLRDNAVGGYVYVYVDMESVDDEQEYYKKLLKEIVKAEDIAGSGKLKSLLEKGNRFFRKIRSITVAGQGIEFHAADSETNYYEDITNFLSGLELDENQKLVLLIDEFPQTVLNIVDAQQGQTRSAIQFLQSNRELRLNPEINEKVCFVYTGSIGLNHTVAAINATAFVNDLTSVEIDPLTNDEATELVNKLLANKSLAMDQGSVDHLLQKINWLIPFHIQLSLQEISSLCKKSETVNGAVIEQAFENMVARRNHNHFEHYYSRLKSQLKGASFLFADTLLQSLAENQEISTSTLYDLAVKIGVQEEWRQILDILVYDGYINNIGTPNTYRFNSPVVRLWWQRFVCK